MSFTAIDPVAKKFQSLRASIIIVEGVIGVGKTTFGRSTAAFLSSLGFKAQFFPEFVNETLLKQYIGDMAKYAYSFQLFMLTKRLEIYKEAQRFADGGGIAVVDRSLPGDMAFAKMQHTNGNITDEEWKVYLSLAEQDSQLEPRAVIFLDCSPEKSLERTHNRGNKAETSGYTLDYMKQLSVAYKAVVEQLKCSLVRVDWNEDRNVTNNRLSNDDIVNILEDV